MEGISEEGKLRSYPKIYAIGHRAIADLFSGPVVVQEKIDGSQLSWGIDGLNRLYIRSKKAIIDPDDPPALFAPSVISIKKMHDEGRLVTGRIYRGEAMCSNRHNSLEYKRAPNGNIVLFDVDDNVEDRIDPKYLESMAKAVGIESAKILFRGEVDSQKELMELLTEESSLGGMIEGIVVKNYDRFNPLDGKMLMGKLVSKRFREIHSKKWGESNKSQNDVISTIVDRYGTPQRWEKAVQHLREQDLLQDAPQDIGPLIKEVQNDIDEECSDEIGRLLWNSFKRQILKRCSSGLPEWYKATLVEKQFEEADNG